MKITNTLLTLILVVIIYSCYMNYNNTDNKAKRWVKQNCKNYKNGGNQTWMNAKILLNKKGKFAIADDKFICGSFFQSRPEYFIDK